MWALLTLGFPPPKESQALRLTGLQEENDNVPTKAKADNLRPLKNTGPFGPKEKKVRLRLCGPKIKILLKRNLITELK